jgi:hypothetical protein
VAVLSEVTGDEAANRRRADIPGHVAVVQPCEPSFLRQSITSPLAFSVPMVGRYQLTSALTLLGLAFSTLFAAAGTDTAAGGDSLLAAGGNDNGNTSSKTGHFVTDEIQVYNAEIAKVGQWTLQFHFNYAIKGLKEPDFEGGIIPNHALNGTPELAYGVTEWWEIGFYAPYAMDQAGEFSSNAGKIRSLFVPPNAAKREFFYGVNFEVSYATPRFSETRWNMEIRPIIGCRKNEVEFIVNTIVDIGFGTNGDVTFTPAARLARNFGENFALGIEYYTGLGPLQNFVPFNNQQHNIYAVTDFKIGRWDVNAGIGYGLTSASDRWMAKMIIGTNLNEGVSDKSSEQPKMMRRVSAPMTGLFRTAVSASEAMLPRGF